MIHSKRRNRDTNEIWIEIERHLIIQFFNSYRSVGRLRLGRRFEFVLTIHAKRGNRDTDTSEIWIEVERHCFESGIVGKVGLVQR